MSRRGRWITLAAGAVVLLGGVSLVVTADGGDPPAVPAVAVPDTTAEVVAVVCRRILTDFAAQVRGDAPAEEVLSDLDRTLAIARAGADRDSAVEPLAAGVGALRESLATDDPAAADVALRVLRTACADT